MIENGLIKIGSALDVCIGTGKNAFLLVQQGFLVTGIDIWSKAVEYWTDIAEKEVNSIDFLNHSFPQFPFRDEKFDFIYDLGCFYHLLEMDRNIYIGEIHRTLKKGGSYLLVVLSDKNVPASNYFTKKDIKECFSDLFKIRLIQHVPSSEKDGNTLYFYAFLFDKK